MNRADMWNCKGNCGKKVFNRTGFCLKCIPKNKCAAPGCMKLFHKEAGVRIYCPNHHTKFLRYSQGAPGLMEAL